MLHSGRVVFGEMDLVVFGRPAAEVLAEEARHREAERVFLMASGTLNRQTDVVDTVRGVGYMAVRPPQQRTAAKGRWRDMVRARDRRSTRPSRRRRIPSGIAVNGASSADRLVDAPQRS